MNLVVAIKQVEDPAIPPTHLKLEPSGKRVISIAGTPRIINGYDANALEEALRLKERHGGKITAISLGDENARKAIKQAIAMGVDAGVLLSDPAWTALDSMGIASVLAAGIRKIGKVDLVLCGRQSSDSDAGQVLYWLAEMLALPVVSPTIKVEQSEAEFLVVHQLMEEAVQRLRVRLPALIGVSSEMNEPRQFTPKGTIAAARMMIPAWNASFLGLKELPPKVSIEKLEIQVRTGKAKIIEGESPAASGKALADKLHQLGFLQ